jgi:hypothetical protein
MEGPWLIQGQIQVAPENKSLVQWITSLETQVVDATNQSPISQEFLCHSNLIFAEKSFVAVRFRIFASPIFASAQNFINRVWAFQFGLTSQPLYPIYSFYAPSDQIAQSSPLGSVKWNRRPPGNEKISLVSIPFRSITPLTHLLQIWMVEHHQRSARLNR